MFRACVGCRNSEGAGALDMSDEALHFFFRKFFHPVHCKGSAIHINTGVNRSGESVWSERLIIFLVNDLRINRLASEVG